MIAPAMQTSNLQRDKTNSPREASMLHSRPIRFLSAVLVVSALAGCSKDTPTTPETPPSTNPETPPPPPPSPTPTEGDIFLAGARTAWAYVENTTQAST